MRKNILVLFTIFILSIVFVYADNLPIISISANNYSVENVAVIVVNVFDIGSGKGLEWIRLYEDNGTNITEITNHSCNLMSSCVLSKSVVHMLSLIHISEPTRPY